MALAWAAIFFGLYGLLIHTSEGRRLDEWMFNAFPRHHSVWFRLSGALIGSEPLWTIAGIALAVAIGLRAHRVGYLIVGLTTVAVSLATAEVLKHVLLSRPGDGAHSAVSNSFPSGHTVAAAATIMAIWFVADRRGRPVVVAAGSVLCVLVGLATVIQQWHRPSDVVSGYALVAACACTGSAILARRPEPVASQ